MNPCRPINYIHPTRGTRFATRKSRFLCTTGLRDIPFQPITPANAITDQPNRQRRRSCCHFKAAKTGTILKDFQPVSNGLKTQRGMNGSTIFQPQNARAAKSASSSPTKPPAKSRLCQSHAVKMGRELTKYRGRQIENNSIPEQLIDGLIVPFVKMRLYSLALQWKKLTTTADLFPDGGQTQRYVSLIPVQKKPFAIAD